MNEFTQDFESTQVTDKKEPMIDRVTDATGQALASIIGMASVWNITYLASKAGMVKDFVAIAAGLTTIICTVLVARHNLRKK